MMRFSPRVAMLERYEKAWRDRIAHALVRFLQDDDPFEDALNMYFVERAQEAKECRYFSRNATNKQQMTKVFEFLVWMGAWHHVGAKKWRTTLYAPSLIMTFFVSFVFQENCSGNYTT